MHAFLVIRSVFIDYLRAIKDHLEFNRNLKSIYPSELQLKKEKNCKFWSIIFRPFHYDWKQNIKTQFYDKRDVLPFSFVLLTSLDSNTPSNIYYASIILRFSRNYVAHEYLCNTFQSSFEENAETRRKHRSIISLLNKSFGKHFTVLIFIKLFSLP